MCVAVPMKVLRVAGQSAWVELGGVQKEIRLDTLGEPVKEGDYLLAHAGFAIQVVDEDEAQKTLAYFREILADEP